MAECVKHTSLLHGKTVYNTGPRGVKIKSQFCRLNVGDRSFCQCDTSPSDKTQTLVSGWELEIKSLGERGSRLVIGTGALD